VLLDAVAESAENAAARALTAVRERMRVAA